MTAKETCVFSIADWPFASTVPGLTCPAVLPEPGARILAMQAQYEQSQYWNRHDIALGQLQQLRQLISHAVSAVSWYDQPAYRQWLRLGDGEAWLAFKELPVVDRHLMQEQGKRFSANRVPDGHGTVSSGNTSGSTGRPLTFFGSELFTTLVRSVTLREHIWHGRDVTGVLATLRASAKEGRFTGWGPPLSYLMSCGEAATFPAMEAIDRQVAWLGSVDPHYLITTPSVVSGFLDAADVGSLRLTRLREVRTLAETVTDDFRDRVARRWAVPVTDMYSTSELGTVAIQCRERQGYHVMEELYRAEILAADDQPCGPGQVGRLVVTCLHNFAMPFIRYDTGDYAEWADTPCPCGRHLPRLARILGRRRNRLHHPDGRVSWPNFSSMDIAAMDVIRRFHVRQTGNRGLVFRYVADTEIDRELQSELTSAILQRAGCQLPLMFEKVEELPLSPAGKFEDFISDVV